MTLRARQQFFHSLAQLLRVGVTFPQALEKLARTARGPVRDVVRRMRRSLDKGHTVAEACGAAELSRMEAAVLTAVERAGSLDRGLEQLSEYYGTMAAARGRALAKLAYPAFLLILGVFLLNVPLLVTHNVGVYLSATVPLLGGVMVGIVLFCAAARVLWSFASFSGAMEELVHLVPLVGGLHRALAMSRFCLAYELQLDAGINVLNALETAGEASQSASVRKAIRRALPKIRAGEQVGPLLARSRAFDRDVMEGILIGEESGSLGVELRRHAALQSDRAFARLNAIAEWLPRLIYLAVVAYIGWRVVEVYGGVINKVRTLIEGE